MASLKKFEQLTIDAVTVSLNGKNFLFGITYTITTQA